MHTAEVVAAATAEYAPAELAVQMLAPDAREVYRPATHEVHTGIKGLQVITTVRRLYVLKQGSPYTELAASRSHEDRPIHALRAAAAEPPAWHQPSEKPPLAQSPFGKPYEANTTSDR